jgi:hypothetical protein
MAQLPPHNANTHNVACLRFLDYAFGCLLLAYKCATHGQASGRNLAVVEDRRSGKCRKRHVGGGQPMPLQPSWAKSGTIVIVAIWWISRKSKSRKRASVAR